MKKQIKLLIVFVLTIFSVGIFTNNAQAEQVNFSPSQSIVAQTSKKSLFDLFKKEELSIPKTAPENGIYDPKEQLNEDVEGALAAFNEAWIKNENGHHPQLGIVFLDSLRGENLEEVSLKTSRNWKIGDNSDKLGILLLVSVKDKKWRVEVSDNLGGVLTDSQAHDLGESMKSDFRNGDYSSGVIRFITGLNQTLADGYGESVVDLGYEIEKKFPLFVVIFVVVFLIFIIAIDILYDGVGYSSGFIGSSSGGDGWSGGGFGGGGASGGW